MILSKLHKTLNSLHKKNYIIEFWNDNNFTIMLSFYHLNSVYNGLCYIDKDTGSIKVDFQHHQQNKVVKKQLEIIGNAVYNLYKLNQLETVKTILNNYKSL